MKPHGFMLLELMVVIALGVVVCFFVLPSFTVFDRMVMRHELNALFLRCMAMQRKAMLSGVSCEIVFDPENRRYICDQERFTLPSPVRFGVPSTVYGPPSSAQKPIKSPVTFPNNRIIFYPEGTISAGTAYFTASGCSYALSVAVSQVSYLRRYVYERDKWIAW